MEIKLNIDETQLKDVLDNQLAALTPEQPTDLIKECITEYLRQNNGEAIKALFIERDYRGSFSYGNNKPIRLTEEIVKKIDFSDVTDPIVAEMKEELHTNSRSILEGILLKALTKSLFGSTRNQNWFFEEMFALHNQLHPPQNN